MGAGVGVLEVAVPPAGGTATTVEGPAPHARGTTPFLAPLARVWLPERCGCSRVAPWVLSVTGPLPTRTGTGSLAPDEPITVIVFLLGAMVTKSY